LYGPIAEPEFRQDPADMLFTVASEANSFATISALDRPGGRRLRERQIDLLCASPAMAATVLSVAPNGGSARVLPDFPRH
jgi:hypothetical protein